MLQNQIATHRFRRLMTWGNLTWLLIAAIVLLIIVVMMWASKQPPIHTEPLPPLS